MFKEHQKHQKYPILLSLAFVLAFIALRHVFHELHEFGHMIAGRLFCGEFGTRDFNRVALPENCVVTPSSDFIIAFAGPMVNYCMIWLGAVLIRNGRAANMVSWGLCLIFANLPLARLVTVLFGGGDELGIARDYFADPLVARIFVTLVICAVLAYPLCTAYRALAAARFRTWLFLGFLVLPMLLEGALVLALMNYILLQHGVLNQTLAFGAPGLAWVVLSAAALVCVFLHPHLATLAREPLPAPAPRIPD